MNTKLILGSIALLVGTGYGSAVMAQAKPDVLVKQRQAVMTLQGKYFGPLNAMASGKVPYNAEVVARNAAFLDALTKMPWDGFTENTKDEKTRALPTVFTESAKFKESADRIQAAISGLVKVSKGGDEASVKTAINEVNKACAGCHDNFRAK